MGTRRGGNGSSGTGGGAIRRYRAMHKPPTNVGSLSFVVIDSSGKRIRGRYTFRQAQALARSLNAGKPPMKWVRLKAS